MSNSPRSELHGKLARELETAASSSPFDGDLAVKIGTRVAARRSLCPLSKMQLAARLGISAADMLAYEQGEKRISYALLLEIAKPLKATPRFFFQYVMSDTFCRECELGNQRRFRPLPESLIGGPGSWSH
jgi:transcriptional regulator with XRE-family HTH domain